MEDKQTTEEEAPSLVNHAIKHGVILGVISILLVIICYVVDISLMVTFKFLGLVTIISLGYVIYAGINYRTETGGFLPYGKAFVHGVVLLAISGLIGTFFNILLYHVVDPELPQKLTDAAIQNTEEMMAGFGVAQEAIDQAVDKMRTDLTDQFSIGGQALTYGKSIIAFCIIALITALFVRKNEPVEA